MIDAVRLKHNGIGSSYTVSIQNWYSIPMPCIIGALLRPQCAFCIIYFSELVMHYRKLYEKKLWVKLWDGFDVHHIDMNRNNNHINNLLALPKVLHNEYHNLYPNFEVLFIILPIWPMWLNALSWQVGQLNEFHKVYAECLKRVHYKMHFTHWLPNM